MAANYWGRIFEVTKHNIWIFFPGCPVERGPGHVSHHIHIDYVEPPEVITVGGKVTIFAYFYHTSQYVYKYIL